MAALAAIVEARGRLAEAAALYRRALAVFGRVLGPTSLEVGLNLACLAAVEQRRGRAGARPSLYAAGARDPGAGARPPPRRRRA